MEDSQGNLPYLEELEGINKNGELFFTYFFEKLNSVDISEKITYAKLYKDYDWIIAMGVHLDEIDAYTEKINDQVIYSSSESITNLLRYIFIVLLIGFLIIYLVERKSTKSLQKEINLDGLTQAFSRKYGERKLNIFLRKYKLTGKNVAVMLFDIDDFKTINDRHGHEYGDIALKKVVDTINSTIRSSDEIIRWGGDEFVGIFPGLREENLRDFGEKILKEIESLEIPIEDKKIKISISVGFSYFKTTDETYCDVLKRADDAMYKSKEEGKNRINI